MSAKKEGRQFGKTGDPKKLNSIDFSGGELFVKGSSADENLKSLEQWLWAVQPCVRDFGKSQVPNDLYALTEKVSLFCDTRGIDPTSFWDICRALIASVRPSPRGWAGSRPTKEAIVEAFRQAHLVFQRLVALLVQEAGEARNTKKQIKLSKEQPRKTADKKTKEIPWDENNPDFMPGSEAIARLADNKIALSTLSSKLKPDGDIRYMRKGQRNRVHIGDFVLYLKNEHPALTIKPETLDERAEEIIADRLAMQAKISGKK